MKKIALVFGIIFCTYASLHAQSNPTNGSSTADVQLNVKLNAIQSITANVQNVDLVYNTIEDYKNGVSKTEQNHLTVYSTGGFTITVQSSADNITASRGNETIESSGITVAAKRTGETKGAPVQLAKTPAVLYQSAKGGADEKFDVTYAAKGENAYINKFFKGTGTAQDATVYTTTVTYSIEAK